MNAISNVNGIGYSDRLDTNFIAHLETLIYK
jgi:hypothetical protein